MNKDQKNNNKSVFSTLEVVILVIVSLAVGMSSGLIFGNKTLIKNNYVAHDKYLNEFVRNYDYIVNNYYEDVDKEKLINSAISGMMESLGDPYSTYFDESESNSFSILLEGSYEGIGISFFKDPNSGYMVISSIIKNSPAEEAGLIPGDIITSINGSSTKDMQSNDVVSLVKQSTSPEFKLNILREEEQLDITLNKNMIKFTSVTTKTYNVDDKKVGYIYIGIFANNTYSQFKEELTKLEKEKIDYLIIDVRGNTGGHLTAVDGILDLFLDESQIKYQLEKNNSKRSIYSNGSGNKKYSIILLGDEASASASEVLISSLKENLGLTFIGKKTYGKGTVQELVTLSDGTQYKFTTQKWLTPKGNWINDTEGIEPDILVDLDSKYYETYSDEDDTQLQRALQYIKDN